MTCNCRLCDECQEEYGEILRALCGAVDPIRDIHNLRLEDQRALTAILCTMRGKIRDLEERLARLENGDAETSKQQLH